MPTITLLLLSTLLAAEPTAEQLALLKTFRGEFVALTPGEGKFPATFTLGSSDVAEEAARPPRTVTLRRPFAIARYEVPQNLWQAVMGANPSRWKGARNSVEMLSRAEAEEFCRRATEQMRAAGLIEPRETIRLPSEVEWEYAARAGTATRYSFGDDAAALGTYAWFTGNAAGNDPPVGAKEPNAWGLYDVHGYLWEWCRDDWAPSLADHPAEGAPFRAADEAGRRLGVLRGGSWKDPAERLTSSFRRPAERTLRDDAVGLRCVLAVDDAAAEPGRFTPTAQAEIVPADARLQVLWNDGDFTEGPAAARDGSIYFTDIGNRILRYNPADGQTAVYRDPSGRANGLMFDARGRLVACEGANTGGGRRISVTEADGSIRTLADSYDGRRFNSPNDLVIDARGNVYFTDPRYAGDEPRELDFEAVLRVTPAGEVSVATRVAVKPNGIIISPDGRYVYVADHPPERERRRLLLRFEVGADGALVNPRELFDFGELRGIDGMTIDTQGRIFATAGSGPTSGIYVFGPEGEHLALIPLPGDPTNCTFGRGAQAGVLYITGLGPAPEQPGARRRYALYSIAVAAEGYHGGPARE